jgi:hypothetical protein
VPKLRQLSVDRPYPEPQTQSYLFSIVGHFVIDLQLIILGGGLVLRIEILAEENVNKFLHLVYLYTKNKPSAEDDELEIYNKMSYNGKQVTLCLRFRVGAIN